MCKAKLRYRGSDIRCQGIGNCEYGSHECDGIYWRDGDGARDKCIATSSYCGKHLECEQDGPIEAHHHGRQHTCDGLAWNDGGEARPYPMFWGRGPGTTPETHAQITAAEMQDATNRYEYAVRLLIAAQEKGLVLSAPEQPAALPPTPKSYWR